MRASALSLTCIGSLTGRHPFLVKSIDQDEFYMSLLVEIQRFFFGQARLCFLFALGRSFREALLERSALGYLPWILKKKIGDYINEISLFLHLPGSGVWFVIPECVSL